MRHYHTLEHLDTMFTLLEEVRAKEVVHDELSLYLAILFHDLIYDATRTDNELESIVQFRAFATDAGLAADVTDRIDRYIRATIRHQLPDGEEGAPTDVRLFLDLDLSVLGRSFAGYALYAAQIRQEYGHMAETDYRKGRAAVLRRFLDRERLYFTDVVRDALEASARRNLAREIAHLENAKSL